MTPEEILDEIKRVASNYSVKESLAEKKTTRLENHHKMQALMFLYEHLRRKLEVSNEKKLPTAQEIADELEGSGKTLIEVLTTHNAPELENNFLFCNELDSLVFNCDDCGWWHEINDMSENHQHICKKCSGDC